MRKYIFVGITMGIVLGLNLYFRFYPVYFPQLKEQAKNIVFQGVQQRIAQNIFSKFPQYDLLAKDNLFKTSIKIFYKNHKKDMVEQINKLYLQLKDRFQDEDGQTYLMELDCWHWARYVKNVYELGHPGDEVIDGKQFDKFMLAPQGVYLHFDNFLFYFSSFLYKIFSFFKYIHLFKFLFYLPLFFIFLFIIFLYFFCYRLGGYICSVTSCIFIGLFASFIPRSCAGWFDKDILNMLFPILIISTYLKIYDTQLFSKKLFFIFLSSFCVGLFCFTWLNWWFIFTLIVFYEAANIFLIKFINLFYKKDTNLLKEHTYSLIFFVSFSLFWIILLCGFEPFKLLFIQLKETIRLTNPLVTSIWPNVYSTVGELKRTTLAEISEAIGGRGIFIVSSLSILILAIYNLFFVKKRDLKSEVSIVLFFWFIFMLFGSLQGVRFIVFLSIPIGISFGILLNNVYQYLKSKKRFVEGFLILAIGVGILSYASIVKAIAVSKGLFPLMNDPWYKFLNLLAQTTPNDTILNSWWDFGDWFKVVAKRRVIFDGQSQNNPQAYWMAKTLLSWDEDEAISILRMLNNGANKAFEIINSYLKEPLRSVLLLEKVLGLGMESAKKTLSDYLPKSSVDKVILLLFDKPPPAYFIVDYSMIPKISAISYLGNWNLSKVYIALNFNTQEKEKILEYLTSLGKDRDYVLQLYQEAFLIPPKQLGNWISRPVQFYSDIVNGVIKDREVFFNNGFVYKIEEKNLISQNGYLPRSLFIENNGKIEEIVFSNPNVIYSVLIFKDKNGDYKLVCLDRQLGKSLFVRLYFLRGRGLKKFTAHIDVEDGKNYLGSYQINW
ncbi:MAG: dolichyl-diphosphooligosaccharide--protein glycosyltransferase subunit STT3 [Candidatus Omnitrophica bacterium]|nr:dolichyl-diphosphooligosaccharide--protein glycosyltransferase subunit STT3 [Candidatus Omnitrophota bacterium]